MKSLQAFLSNLIDYAGLFPPAALSLPEAITNYGRYRHQPDRWMLGRFIIPATRLDELSTLAGTSFTADDPYSFSILGRSGRNSDDFLAGLQSDLDALTAFRQRHGPAVLTNVFETRLPPGNHPGKAGALQHLLVSAGHLLAPLTPHYEATPGPDWHDTVAATIEAIAHYNSGLAGAAHPAGFKLRCGGVEAAAFPTPAQVAFALVTARDWRVPLKATAGLHHPIRRYDHSVQTHMHGFLNLFGGGILAHVHNLDQPTLQTILEDQNPAAFTFTHDTFAWQHLHATADQITHLRATALISYGSCSFDEPRQDLHTLALL
jgi:hypothetical protein